MIKLKDIKALQNPKSKKYKQKINFNYNPDIDRDDMVEKLHIKDNIVEFLNVMGEVSAAKFLESEFLNPKKLSKEEMDEDFLDELIKNAKTNKNILEVLKKIQQDLIDEQDTSINQYRMSEAKGMNLKFSEFPSGDDDDDGWSFPGIPFNFGRGGRRGGKGGKGGKGRNRNIRPNAEYEENRNGNNRPNNTEENRNRNIRPNAESEENRNGNSKPNAESEENRNGNNRPNNTEENRNGNGNNRPNNTEENNRNNSNNRTNNVAPEDKKNKKTLKDYLAKAKGQWWKIALITGLYYISTSDPQAFENFIEKDLDEWLNEKITYDELCKRVQELVSSSKIILGDAASKALDFYVKVESTKTAIVTNVSNNIKEAFIKENDKQPAYLSDKKLGETDLNLGDGTLGLPDNNTYITEDQYVKQGVDALIDASKQGAENVTDASKKAYDWAVKDRINNDNIILGDESMSGVNEEYYAENRERELKQKKEENRKKYEEDKKLKDLEKKLEDEKNNEYERKVQNANETFKDGKKTVSLLRLGEAWFGDIANQQKNTGKVEALKSSKQQLFGITPLEEFEPSLIESIASTLSKGLKVTADWMDPSRKQGLSEEEFKSYKKNKNKYDEVKNVVPFLESSSYSTIEELIKRNVLKQNKYGLIDIINHNEVEKLSFEKLVDIFYNEYSSDETKEEIGHILSSKTNKVKIAKENLKYFEKPKEIEFSLEDMLSTELLGAKNDLDIFIAEHPLTDENIIEEEKVVDGKIVKTFKYKDEQLNKEFLELQKKYDDKFRKYADNRANQIRILNEAAGKSTESVEGEVLSEAETKEYLDNKDKWGSSQNYIMDKADKQAQKTRTQLQEDLKNVQIPDANVDLYNRLKSAEGFTPERGEKAYYDNGHMSIGYGHQVGDKEQYMLAPGYRMTKEEAEYYLKKDIERAVNAASKIPGYAEAPSDVQYALQDMTYNMGPFWTTKGNGGKGWPIFRQQLVDKDYKGLAENIRGSTYYTQVKGRAEQNAKLFERAANISKPEINPNVKSQSNGSSISASEGAKVPTSKTGENDVNEQATTLDKDNAVNSKGNNELKVENETKNIINNTKGADSSKQDINVVAPVINNQNTQASNDSKSSTLNDNFLLSHSNA